jgi:hypothetical protein
MTIAVLLEQTHTAAYELARAVRRT